MRKRQGDPTGHGGRSIDNGLKILTVQISLFAFMKISNYWRFRKILLFGWFVVMDLWGRYPLRQGTEWCILMGCETDTRRVMKSRWAMDDDAALSCFNLEHKFGGTSKDWVREPQNNES